MAPRWCAWRTHDDRHGKPQLAHQQHNMCAMPSCSSSRHLHTLLPPPQVPENVCHERQGDGKGAGKMHYHLPSACADIDMVSSMLRACTALCRGCSWAGSRAGSPTLRSHPRFRRPRTPKTGARLAPAGGQPGRGRRLAGLVCALRQDLRRRLGAALGGRCGSAAAAATLERAHPTYSCKFLLPTNVCGYSICLHLIIIILHSFSQRSARSGASNSQAGTEQPCTCAAAKQKKSAQRLRFESPPFLRSKRTSSSPSSSPLSELSRPLNSD